MYWLTASNTRRQAVTSPRWQRGFTLVEALVALLIFGWIGLGAYQILDQVMISQETQQAHSQRLAKMQRLSWQIQKDFRQMVARPVYDVDGTKTPPFIMDDRNYIVEFTRTGWSNPLQWQRSELQRVAYKIDFHPDAQTPASAFYGDEDLYLLRHYWPVLDRVENSEPNEQVLIGGIVDMELRFYDAADGVWQSELPNPSTLSETKLYWVPPEIEVTLVFDNDEMISHVFRLRE